MCATLQYIQADGNSAPCSRQTEQGGRPHPRIDFLLITKNIEFKSIIKTKQRREDGQSSGDVWLLSGETDHECLKETQTMWLCANGNRVWGKRGAMGIKRETPESVQVHAVSLWDIYSRGRGQGAERDGTASGELASESGASNGRAAVIIG